MWGRGGSVPSHRQHHESPPALDGLRRLHGGSNEAVGLHLLMGEVNLGFGGLVCPSSGLSGRGEPSLAWGPFLSPRVPAMRRGAARPPPGAASGWRGDPRGGRSRPGRSALPRCLRRSPEQTHLRPFLCREAVPARHGLVLCHFFSL